MNSSSAGGDGEVEIEARTPSGRSMRLSAVPRHGGNYVANFNPSEVGQFTSFFVMVPLDMTPLALSATFSLRTSFQYHSIRNYCDKSWGIML